MSISCVKISFGCGVGSPLTEIWIEREGMATEYVTLPCSAALSPHQEVANVMKMLKPLKFQTVLVEDNFTIAKLCADILDTELEKIGNGSRFVSLFNYVRRPTPAAPAAMLTQTQEIK